MWTILGDSLPPGSGILPVGLLSPQRPVDSDWAQEFKPVITSVVREYGCKITSDRMMHAGVISKFQLEEIKRVVKLFCIFENVIDDLEFKSELATPDKLPRVESVRRNRVLRDMEDNEVMAAINGAEDIFGLRMLVVPYLVVHGLPQAATYKLQLVYHKSRTEILFNSHPTTTCADKIVRFMELMVKFVQYALDHDDETIEDCQPSLDVFFDEIICDAKLADCYDPRRSRDVNPGPYVLSSPMVQNFTDLEVFSALVVAAEKIPYPALPFHIAQRNPRLAHLRTDVGEKERQILQKERSQSMNARLEEVAEYIRSLDFPAQRFLRKHRWDVPDPDVWTITVSTLSSGGGILPVRILSPQRPVESAWEQEFRVVVDSVAHEYGCKVTSNRMMQASVIGKFDMDEIQRVAKLLCLFEDVIDDLEFESELAIPDKFPPVESIRHNSLLENMDNEGVMGAIDNTDYIPDLRLLLTPFIKIPGLTCVHLQDAIVRYTELMAKFVQYALDHDDETIENCRPSLDVFFDEIIRDEKLAHFYDPRRSRGVKPGALSRPFSSASSPDDSHSDGSSS
ncbi:hypothetical protein CERSUDRAFT_71499 [Gelatoporia subvermispora B]|uniref:Uncharacterized protein n=1 Tax=Ceriporiopsis subvermispora (strain B) TaxID=914234 RepID=M2RMA7_CERS8|nr:hypothetical protein CERSUDRAFT_71499 [Gelatoporia subvermispora B]